MFGLNFARKLVFTSLGLLSSSIVFAKDYFCGGAGHYAHYSFKTGEGTLYQLSIVHSGEIRTCHSKGTLYSSIKTVLSALRNGTRCAATVVEHASAAYDPYSGYGEIDQLAGRGYMPCGFVAVNAREKSGMIDKNYESCINQAFSFLRSFSHDEMTCRMRQGWIGVGYGVAGLIGLCLLRCIYKNIKAKCNQRAPLGGRAPIRLGYGAVSNNDPPGLGT